MSYLALAKKIQAELKSGAGAELEADPTEGRIVAVLIDSPTVGLVWFAQSDSFKSGDGIPVFFMSEVPILEKMEPAELRRRYQQRLESKKWENLP